MFFGIYLAVRCTHRKGGKSKKKNRKQSSSNPKISKKNTWRGRARRGAEVRTYGNKKSREQQLHVTASSSDISSGSSCPRGLCPKRVCGDRGGGVIMRMKAVGAWCFFFLMDRNVLSLRTAAAVNSGDSGVRLDGGTTAKISNRNRKSERKTSANSTFPADRRLDPRFQANATPPRSLLDARGAARQARTIIRVRGLLHTYLVKIAACYVERLDISVQEHGQFLQTGTFARPLRLLQLLLLLLRDRRCQRAKDLGRVSRPVKLPHC